MPNPTHTIADQQRAFAVLAALSAEHPNLPAPYIVVHADCKGVGIQLHEPADFEAWRAALGIETVSVDLVATRNNTWLQADTKVADVTVHLTGFGINAPSVTLVKAVA